MVPVIKMIGDATFQVVNFASTQKSLFADPETGSCVDPDPKPETISRSNEETHPGSWGLTVVPLQNDSLVLRLWYERVPFKSGNDVSIVKPFYLV